MSVDITDDHLFKKIGTTFVEDNAQYSIIKFDRVICRYCGYETLMNSIGEYLKLSDYIKCLSEEEKIIKDLIE